tara:strand:- start:6010 stop:6198 length:189 start_codon:yes stop_codon:yes gene_type:complete
MPKFRVTATMDVGYELIVEASHADIAWQMAKENDTDWVKIDDGHEWTMEDVHPVNEEEKTDD